MGAAWGDYDTDGWPDPCLTHLGPNQFLHNNGDDTFTDVTRQAGVAGGKTQLNSSALWFDYDRVGDLDLYVSNWEDTVLQASDRDTGDWLHENLGDRTFLDVSQASGSGRSRPDLDERGPRRKSRRPAGCLSGK